MFLDDLSRIPPERKIDFDIDLFLNMKHIYIPPYLMDPVQLKIFLDKGIIRLSISSRGTSILFV